MNEGQDFHAFAERIGLRLTEPPIQPGWAKALYDNAEVPPHLREPHDIRRIQREREHRWYLAMVKSQEVHAKFYAGLIQQILDRLNPPPPPRWARIVGKVCAAYVVVSALRR